MPRDKTVSFKEFVRRLQKGQASKVIPADIFEKMDEEGVGFKVSVSDEMRNYWQSKLDENPGDDTAMRVLYIANGNITLLDDIDYDKDMECFILDSVETDGFPFDLPPFFEIRTQDEINRMDKSLKQNAVNTSFFVDVFDLDKFEEAPKQVDIGELTEQQKVLRGGRKRNSSPKPRRIHTKAIRLAFDSLPNPTNEEVYEWLKVQSDSDVPKEEYLGCLDFYGQDVQEFGSTTLEDELIFIVKNKNQSGETRIVAMVTKKNFQDICSINRRN